MLGSVRSGPNRQLNVIGSVNSASTSLFLSSCASGNSSANGPVFVSTVCTSTNEELAAADRFRFVPASELSPLLSAIGNQPASLRRCYGATWRPADPGVKDPCTCRRSLARKIADWAKHFGQPLSPGPWAPAPRPPRGPHHRARPVGPLECPSRGTSLRPALWTQHCHPTANQEWSEGSGG